MSSKPSIDYYSDLTKMSRLRAIAMSLITTRNDSGKIEMKCNPARAYELARQAPHIAVTDLPIYEGARKRLDLAPGSTIIDDCHGSIVGRTAQARRFYNKASSSEKRKLENLCLDAAFQMKQKRLLIADAIIGLDKDLMLKAILCTTRANAPNLFNWLVNFAWMEALKRDYEESKELDIQDIIFISFPDWESTDPDFKPPLVIFDPYENVAFSFGMRYFGELKKGTLTMAWTSGMRLGQVACHGGIKEIDFSQCEDEKYRSFGKKVIGFYGLSGSGKSSHTNSKDNAGSLPAGIKKTILHDDAFQIDVENKSCRVWEPSLFDKMDKRDTDHPDWKYVISTQNNGTIEKEGKIVPLAQDIRNNNSRALLDRDLLGHYTNKIGYPNYICWLMKDSTLPPIFKCDDKFLAVAMGATLMTKRTAAENVSVEEMKKLVFEPFANPFRVYELYKDVEGFLKVLEAGTECFVFNSGGFWESSDAALKEIPLKLSLRLQTALLLDELEWEEWSLLSGAMVPTPETIDKLWPDYSETYSTENVQNKEQYLELMKDRFRQRRDFLIHSDINHKPGLLKQLLTAFSGLAPSNGE
jgi:phosphoenolpyruvate carboxykinase (ATP)